MTFSSSVFVRSGWNLCLISLHTVAIFSVAPLFLFSSNLCWEDESLIRKMSKSVGGRSLFPSENPSVFDSLTFSLSVTTSVSEKEEGCLCLQIFDSSELAPDLVAIGKPSKINDVNVGLFWSLSSVFLSWWNLFEVFLKSLYLLFCNNHNIDNFDISQMPKSLT